MFDGDIDFITAAVLLRQALLTRHAERGGAADVCGTLHGVGGAGGVLAIRLTSLPPTAALVGCRLVVEPDGPSFDLARRPFGRSPGRWWLRCEGCARWVVGLALARQREAPGARHWRCRRCQGLPAPAQRLSHRQRLLQALARAEDAPMRRHNESRQRWLRRLARAEVAQRRANQSAEHAEESFGAQVSRLAAPTTDDSDNSPSNSELSARVARKTDLPGEGS